MKTICQLTALFTFLLIILCIATSDFLDTDSFLISVLAGFVILLLWYIALGIMLLVALLFGSISRKDLLISIGFLAIHPVLLFLLSYLI